MKIGAIMSLLKTILSISCGFGMVDLHNILDFVILPGTQFYDGMEKNDHGFLQNEIQRMI